MAASVERRSESSGWETIGAATTDGREFQYVDTQPPAGRVAYRLSYATVRGTEFTPETWATVPSAHALGLIGFAPNPATGRSARVGFTLPGNVAAHLAVYDAAGREVFAREVGSLGPGRHSVEIGSATLASGLYWVQLRHGGETLRSRGVVVR